jgi:glycosyltransferase involved in cell wall biosynthesis
MNNHAALISVVVPVFNEELTISDVIKRINRVVKKNRLRHEIIVVDDCSEDGSLKASKLLGVKAYSLNKHMGKGFALRTGFKKAKGEIIATIDSDGSHRPEELPLLLAPILQNQADLVIGSRYLNHEKVRARKVNIFGVRLFNFLIKIFTRTKISDSQSGYRVMKSEILKKMRLNSAEYEIESEMLVKTARLGFRIKEVPISFEQRTYGASRIDPLMDGFKILLSILLSYIKS